MTITDWLRNLITRFIWPCIAANIEQIVHAQNSKQQREYQQELRAFMLEQREYVRNSSKPDPLHVRQVDALEKLVIHFTEDKL